MGAGAPAKSRTDGGRGTCSWPPRGRLRWALVGVCVTSTRWVAAPREQHAKPEQRRQRIRPQPQPISRRASSLPPPPPSTPTASGLCLRAEAAPASPQRPWHPCHASRCTVTASCFSRINYAGLPCAPWCKLRYDAFDGCYHSYIITSIQRITVWAQPYAGFPLKALPLHRSMQARITKQRTTWSRMHPFVCSSIQSTGMCTGSSGSGPRA